MAYYGADIGELREFARQLSAGSDSLENARRALQSSVTSAPWRGPDGEELRSRWSSELAPALVEVAGSLRTAAQRIRANADDQERTSTDSGGPHGGGSQGGGSHGGGGSQGGGSHSGGSGAGSSGAGGSDAGGDDAQGGPKVTIKGGSESGSDNGLPGSPATEGSGSKIGGGVTYDPETGETTSSGSGSLQDWMKTTDGSKISFGVKGGAEYTTGEKSGDGFTTYTSKSDVSIGVEGGISKNGTGVSGGYSTGLTSEYQVKIPDSAGDVDPGSINPFDPRSMPVGSSVTMNGGDYTKTDLNAAYHHIAIESSVKDASGVSSVIERVDDSTVRVTAGPTEALTNSAGLGVDFDAIKAMLSGSTTMGGQSLRTADFDLSTTEGQAAYDRYLVTGELPSDPSAGVSGTTRIERLDYDSTAKAGFDTPVGGAEVQLGQNTGSKVMTTYPDGTSEQLTTANYGETGDFRMQQTYDSSGAEDMSARTYTYEVTANDLTAQYLNSGDWFPQSAVPGQVSAGDTVALTFTEAQMDRLAQYAAGADPLGDAYGLSGEKVSAFELAAILARTSSDEQRLIENISQIYQSR
ncbi:WXG100 family type VII secretion target [Microbacterium yannicii]|nr:hypothetical protein [Microbacterium yannicii]MCO5954067.1 hypothetical protein [Microbacterium yannicii]